MAFALTARQRKTLSAICDTFNPVLQPDPTDNPLFFSNGTANWPIVERLEHHLGNISEGERKFVLNIIDRLDRLGRGWRLGVSLRSFAHLDLEARVRSVKRLLTSRNQKIRALFRSIQRLALQGSYVGRNTRESVEGPSHRELYDSIGYVTGNFQVAGVERLSASTISAGQRILACDYLVIGSGAGGAVMAAELAETGKKVLLVDAGEIVNRSELGQSESFASMKLFETFGAFDCGDNEVLITTGKTFGGGPVANWGTCLNPPRSLLEQWAREFGFVEGLSENFQHSLFTVRRRLQVSDATSQVNRQNEILRKGLDHLGWRASLLERNAVNCPGCDRCEFGCASAARQDTRETYLLDAQRLGVYLLPNCKVDRLICDGPSASSAIAVLRRQTDDVEVEIKFKNVMLAAGAIHSPAILMRSGIKGPHLGRNLHVQPAAVVSAFHRTPVFGWRGPAQTIASDEFSNLDGQGYGVWLEVAPIHPGLAAMFLPWNHPRHHKQLMQRIGHMATTLVLCRDRGSGRIGLDERGRPRVHYRVGQEDQLHLREGIEMATKVQQAAGAESVFSPTWSCSGQNGVIDAMELNGGRVRPSNGVFKRNHEMKLFSAHQFSTCRIGSSPIVGAIDCCGKLFGMKNVFVSDGSSLPTATGVNPMLTISTVSHFLSQKIKAIT